MTTRHESPLALEHAACRQAVYVKYSVLMWKDGILAECANCMHKRLSELFIVASRKASFSLPQN